MNFSTFLWAQRKTLLWPQRPSSAFLVQFIFLPFLQATSRRWPFFAGLKRCEHWRARAAFLNKLGKRVVFRFPFFLTLVFSYYFIPTEVVLSVLISSWNQRWFWYTWLLSTVYFKIYVTHSHKYFAHSLFSLILFYLLSFAPEPRSVLIPSTRCF